MAVLVGIDEAGFGPILGPLVVSSTAFSLGKDLLAADLWRVLRRSVSDRRKHLAGRVLIADSKKAYTKSLGIKHLERTVLACLDCLGKRPADLTELLGCLCPETLKRLTAYPWYENLDGFGKSVTDTDVRIAAAALQNEMSSKGIKLLALKSCCLDVGHYNRQVQAARNKSSVLFTATCQLIKTAFDNFGGDNLHIIIDRQGGRVRYRKVLQRMFEDMELKIVKESTKLSSYELTTNNKMMKLHFAIGADGRYLPVALASMVSKYIRELLVHNINRYFGSFDAELKPTAGYWKDGTRFIRDIKNRIGHVNFDEGKLIRCR